MREGNSAPASESEMSVSLGLLLDMCVLRFNCHGISEAVKESSEGGGVERGVDIDHSPSRIIVTYMCILSYHRRVGSDSNGGGRLATSKVKRVAKSNNGNVVTAIFNYAIRLRYSFPNSTAST